MENSEDDDGGAGEIDNRVRICPVCGIPVPPPFRLPVTLFLKST
jgi:hypothetical protein